MSVGEIAGVAIGLVGFAVAIWQIVLVKKQVKDAVDIAKATQDAIGNTERLNAVIELMRVIPQMQDLEREVAAAVRANEKEAVVGHLQRWRAIAGEARGLIQEQDFESQTLEARLQESSHSAAQAIDRIDDTDDAVAVTKSVLTTIAATMEDASVLMGKLKARPRVQTIRSA